MVDDPRDRARLTRRNTQATANLVNRSVELMRQAARDMEAAVANISESTNLEVPENAVGLGAALRTGEALPDQTAESVTVATMADMMFTAAVLVENADRFGQWVYLTHQGLELLDKAAAEAAEDGRSIQDHLNEQAHRMQRPAPPDLQAPED